MGNNLGACLQHAMIDLLNHYRGGRILNIHIPETTATYTGGMMTFSEGLKSLEPNEVLEEYRYLFLRHQSYYKRRIKGSLPKRWKKLMFSFYRNGVFLGKIKNNKLIYKRKGHQIKLFFWTNAHKLLEHFSTP
jgi:hypothetical protein